MARPFRVPSEAMALRPLLEEEMLSALRQEVDAYETQEAAAKHLGVSGAFLCDVLNGRRAITKRLAHALGYERQFIYVPYENRL